MLPCSRYCNYLLYMISMSFTIFFLLHLTRIVQLKRVKFIKIYMHADLQEVSTCRLYIFLGIYFTKATFSLIVLRYYIISTWRISFIQLLEYNLKIGNKSGIQTDHQSKTSVSTRIVAIILSHRHTTTRTDQVTQILYLIGRGKGIPRLKA